MSKPARFRAADDHMRFAQKVAVVTGGASGIGRACAVAFAREGAKVAVVDRSPGVGRETVALIRERGGDAVFLHADVTKEEQVGTALAQASETLGGIRRSALHRRRARPQHGFRAG